MGKVWLFIVVEILIATAVSSLSEDSEVEESRTNWQRTRRAVVPPFFVGGRRPEGLPNTGPGGPGVEIQQKLPKDPVHSPPYFVTLFDPNRNIPFYSAYKVTAEQAADLGKNTRKSINTKKWRNPPAPPGTLNPVNVDSAYKEAIKTEPLSRGHMNPVGINTFDTGFMEATLTLTNAVPQYQTSNSGPWQEYEKRISKYAQNMCGCGTRRGTLYLLTGTSNYGVTVNAKAQPIQDPALKPPYTRNTFSNGVRLYTPTAVWTAGCCVWHEPGVIFKMRWPYVKTESFAVMSNNQKNGGLLRQTEMSVPDLERLLKDPASRAQVNLFPGNGKCRRNNIQLEQLYP